MTLALAASAVGATMPVATAVLLPEGPFVDACLPQTDAEGGYPWTHGTGTALGVGQTFELDRTATIDRLTFRLRQERQLAGESFFLSWLERVDETWQTFSVETGVLPADLPVGVPVYVTADPHDLALDPGRKYAFLLEIVGGGYVNVARGEILHVGDDLYASGEAFSSAGATPFEPLDYDLEFILHGTQSMGDVLLLHGDRFAVSAQWTDFDGVSGPGHPVPLTWESGYFWFFSDSNVEVVLKVMDGCTVNDRYWVFAAGLTSVEVMLRVEDRATGLVWTAGNPLHLPFAPVLDTSALAACP